VSKILVSLPYKYNSRTKPRPLERTINSVNCSGTLVAPQAVMVLVVTTTPAVATSAYRVFGDDLVQAAVHLGVYGWGMGLREEVIYVKEKMDRSLDEIIAEDTVRLQQARKPLERTINSVNCRSNICERESAVNKSDYDQCLNEKDRNKCDVSRNTNPSELMRMILRFIVFLDTSHLFRSFSFKHWS
jgi:hypothetical protein